MWQTESTLSGSINNSVLLTSMNLSRSHESAVEPRLGISNNDSTVKFYNVPVRSASKRGLYEIGSLWLQVPVNHSSISPDGRTLLSVGDSSKVFLHQMTGGARITFSPISTLKLPSPAIHLPNYISSSLLASFSTSFSADGSKFAVASQEGLVAVWDVRSTRPLKVFETDKTRVPNRDGNDSGNGEASGWILEETYDFYGTTFRAPGWSVRNVKFGGAGSKEVMTFTEHTSLLHVVDARTFETEQIVRVPTYRPSSSPETSPIPVVPQPQPSPRWSRSRREPPSPVQPFSPTRSPLTMSLPRNSLGNTTSPNRLLISGSSTMLARRQVGPRGVVDGVRREPPSYSAPDSISDSTWRALRFPSPLLQPPPEAAVAGTTRPLSAASSSSSSSSSTSTDLPRPRRVISSGRNRGADVTEEVEEWRRERSGSVADREIIAAMLFGTSQNPQRLERRLEGDLEEEEEEEEEDLNTGSAHADYDYTPVNRRANRAIGNGRREDSMETDEREVESEESESCTPSRSGSPRPMGDDESRLASSPSGSGSGTNDSRRAETYTMVYLDDLDLAGTCFDPSGRFVYVGATEAVMEWGIRGSEKRWWSGTEWM